MNILEVKNSLRAVISNFFQEKYNLAVTKINIDIPEMQFGDLTTNICLQESKNLNKNPIELASELKKYLEVGSTASQWIVDIKGPGFLNFWVDKNLIRHLTKQKSFWENLATFFGATKKENILESKYFGKKILVEHSSPNLFKPFTIGHLMNNFTGEFLVRAMQEAGGQVASISFPSDISIGIAKAIYVIKKDGGLKQNIFKITDENSKNTLVKYLGETYVRGVGEFKIAEEENNHELIREIKDVANKLYGNIQSEELEIYNFTKKVNIEYLFANLEKLGSHFDGFIFESESGVDGKRIVLENTYDTEVIQEEKNIDSTPGSKRVFEKSEGAIIYRPAEERKDLNTMVFINSEGNPTYEAKDIGLLHLKFSRYNPDFSFFITDNEQGPHFKIVLDAAGKIDKRWESDSTFVPHGRMSFKGQRMSSRLGGVPTAEEVIDSVLEAVKEKGGERKVDEETQKEIALSALRISVLRSKPGLNIDFDPERALSFEGDSGPYLCYTSARLHSLLLKGKENGLYPGLKISHPEPGVGTNEKNIGPTPGSFTLERKIFQFESVLKEVVEEIAPQKLVTYLFELSGIFNSFYNENKIIDKENKFLSEHYLFIISKTLEVVTRGLHILGIKAPEKM